MTRGVRPNAALHRLGIGVVLCALGACAAPALPKGAAGIEAPANWSAAASAQAEPTSLAAWWQHFGDPLLSELALAGLRPALSATGSTQRSDPASGGSSRLVQSALEASWGLDLAGSSRRGADATNADLMASEATLCAIRTAVAAEVAIAYVQLRGSQARLAIARYNLRAQRETLEITGTIPEPPAELTLAIPARMLRQRPDVRAAELAVDAAALRVSQSSASQLPSFVMRSSLAWSAMSLGSLGGPAARALIGSANFPLLDGGARRAQVQSQLAQFDAAQVAYDSSVLAALQEVEDAP